MTHLEGQDILIGLSGGINSMAVLCRLKESGVKPKSIHLFYAHFSEHSPDTARFVIAGVRFARQHFENVFVRIERNSILSWFEKNKMIPHPAISPCSRILKIERINKYAFDHDLKIDLVGYVKHELKRRAAGQAKNKEVGLFSLDKQYPIGDFTDEWCFEIVDRNIGWHPAIYDLMWDNPDFVSWIGLNFRFWPPAIAMDVKRRAGRHERVFKHNNCLPCKNMYPHEMIAIEFFFVFYYKNAMLLSDKLKKHWGRDKDQFYSTFGRELGQESTCGSCVW
jgi:3'-phosphoadenosine 5'-phosphosulfate sulfotransferase (PAPS reductase)/FAD synthetase